MKTAVNVIERRAMYAALVMFLMLCGMSAINTGVPPLTFVRNLLFLLTGIGGLLISGQLDAVHNGRLAQTKKRTVRIAQTLLFAFSLIVTAFAMVDLGILQSLARWD